MEYLTSLTSAQISHQFSNSRDGGFYYDTSIIENAWSRFTEQLAGDQISDIQDFIGTETIAYEIFHEYYLDLEKYLPEIEELIEAKNFQGMMNFFLDELNQVKILAFLTRVYEEEISEKLIDLNSN